MAQPSNKGFGSPVVGYIRSATPDDPKFEEYEQQIRDYATAHGFNLVRVVREVQPATRTYKPLLEQIIRDVKDFKCAGIIIVAKSHLGSPNAATHYIRQIRSGGWLTTIDSTL